MALCQKFGRLLIGADARFFTRTDVTNFSTSLNQSPAPKQIPAQLPPGYNAPKSFALFTKDQMTGKSGGPKLLKILSKNWKSLSEDEKQSYSERAKKIGDELRANFEKLTDGQKKDLWDKHVEKRNKLRSFRMKMKLHKIPAQLPSGYALFIKDQMTGKRGGTEIVKIVSTSWKSLDENEKQNYSERAKKIGDELRDNFEKLTDGQKKDLWDKHVEKRNKLQRYRMKKKLQKKVLISRRITQSPTPTQILARLPYNALGAYALFTKDQMTGKSEGTEMMKIISTNWKSLGEDEKQNYFERAQKICEVLRDNFAKLTNRQKKDLWDKHVEKRNKLQRLRMKKKRQKFYAETNRPKQPLPSYLLFKKECFEKQTEPIKTLAKVKKFGLDIGQQWRQMTDAEKKPYVDQTQDNIAKFRVEMAKWKQKYANEIRAWKEAEAKAARKARGTHFTEALFEWNNDDDREVDEKERIQQMLLDDSTHLVEKREWGSDDDRDVDEEAAAIQRMFLAISTYLGRKEISQQRVEY
uniref:HMG box domain-containing protein n=1 Tax=Globodera pallida TaxID=36090 RepID=A0A183BSY8_GLOPA